MKTINLRDFYPWYAHDELVEVSNKVAAALIEGKRYEKAYMRDLYRSEAHYTLDAENGIESKAVFPEMTPHAVLEYKEQFCRLCRAINSLPEKQGRRIESHFVLGMSIKKIAKNESVNERNIRNSLRKGIAGMKGFLNNL
jgi:DNA-directed RNA polymerase specialized sigma24 family protein